MENVIAQAEHIFGFVAQIGVTFLELSGVAVLLLAGLKSIIAFFKRDAKVRLMLAQGIALALEFKMGGEVLRTTIVRDWSELGILGAIIVLRLAMTLFINWEIKHEEARL